MPNIIDVIKPEEKISGVGPDEDVRPWVVAIIRGIESFKPTTRDTHAKVRDLAKRLKSKINGLPEYADLTQAVNKLHERGEQSAGMRTTRRNWQQVQLAARRAYDLILEGGFGVPNLTGEGQYIRLTALLVEAATGREGGTAGKACREYFKELQAQYRYGVPEEEWEKYGLFPYSKKQRGMELSEETMRMLKPISGSEEYRRKLLDLRRKSLDELLDEIGVA
jgi:hypothetical protein